MELRIDSSRKGLIKCTYMECVAFSSSFVVKINFYDCILSFGEEKVSSTHESALFYPS